jgi:hypothetical protein
MSDHTYLTAEAAARLEIDKLMVECGWVLQQEDTVNLYASLGVAVREYRMAPGRGRGDRCHVHARRRPELRSIGAGVRLEPSPYLAWPSRTLQLVLLEPAS